MNDSSDALPPMVPHQDKVPPRGCIVLIGMAASGKTTVGRELASLIGWAHMDTDHLIEAFYGCRLQQITDSMTKEEFLDLEATIIQSLTVGSVVISTGGSVVYRQETMDFLAGLGPLIHIDVPLPIILARIARKPDRGLAINPGQTVEDLYNERQELYRKAAAARFEGSEAPAAGLARAIAEWVATPGAV
ncbi:Shikimate kinase [uncultured delta proteobacterium]|uniref:Shikimate kinase n=1 Tax=uncultured delta proteobacterium TaxID=34034 RepID=A0A212JED6_9DELT|nr:Shikimate kinase [uncultured delta proteobacterium]